MNVHVSYKASKKPDIESQFNLHVEKLRKRLQVFRPELVHLHATVEPSSGREGVSVSLNLRLPSGQMASSGVGPTPVVALKNAFDDLQEQVGKHKARLREKYRWPHLRRGSRETRPQSQVPFEDTVAAVKLPSISSSDISSWVDTNLGRLVRFVERELHYREVNGQLRSGLVSTGEVIDETILAALGDDVVKPERLALEPWLYRLAMRSLDELVAGSAEQEATLSLYQGVRRPNVEASDEAQLQFHQPDEAMVAQDNIPDRGAASPEEIAYSDEMIAMVEIALRGARGEDREAFLLYAIEGFSPEEIAVIGDHAVEEVRESILAAREHLRKNLPVSNELKEKLLQQTKIA
jgi:DNA-directed RNA polymerase specialized sigma24 family protein/ribosome-associated translation inhibitor RaiA